MPKLPDVSDLGFASAPTPSGAVASYNPNQVGQALESAGSAITAEAKDQQDKQDRFDLERARSLFLTKQVEIQSALKDDQDFPTYQARYQKAMTQARAEAAGVISNPQHQQLFQFESDADMARGAAEVQDMVRTKQKDFGRATLTDQLEANRKAALGADSATATKLLRTSNGLIAGAYDRGYIGAEEGVTTRQKYVQDYAQDWLKMQPPENQLALLKPMQGPPVPANLQAPSSADDVINHVIDKFEGAALVPDDAGKGPSKFGINQTANPDADVKNLTREQAVQIYKDSYWNAIGADQLPGDMRLGAFDAAVNFGVPKAKQMIADANGDPAALAQARKDEHARLIAANPDKYGPYKQAWEDRDNHIASTSGGPTLPRTGTPVDFLPADKRAEIAAHLPEIIKAQREQQQTAILDKALPIIQQNNGDWTAIPQDVRDAAMKAGIWNKITEFKGVTNPELKVDLMSMAPDKLAQLNFNDPELRTRLSVDDREYFAKQAQDFRDKPADASLMQNRHEMVMDAFQKILPGAKLEEPQHKAQVATFNSLLDADIEAFKNSHNGKAPERSDLQAMIDGRLMTKVKQKEWSWLSFGHTVDDTDVFDVKVPDADRQQIIDTLHAVKMPVTEGEILRRYLIRKDKEVGK